MARTYSRRKVIATVLLEWFASIFLSPIFSRRTNDSLPIRRILFVEPFQMGDILSITCLLPPLIAKYPEAEFYFLTKPRSGSTLEYDSRVKGVFTVDFPWADHGEKKFSLGRTLRVLRFAFSLRSVGFDLGIDTRGDIRSQIVMLLAGCRSRLGYTNYLNSNINLRGSLLTHAANRSDLTHRYEWNLHLLTSIGFKPTELFPAKFPCYVPDKLTLHWRTEKALVIHVGAGWEYRRWPTPRWTELINALQARFERIYLIGGKGETEILKEIESNLVHTGKVTIKVTTLTEMIQLIHQCHQFIGLDSGPMNLAVCMNKPTVALFGPGDVSLWRPLNEGGRYIQKTEKFPCSPCNQITCIFPKRNCMHEIEVKEVVNMISDI